MNVLNYTSGLAIIPQSKIIMKQASQKELFKLFYETAHQKVLSNTFKQWTNEVDKELILIKTYYASSRTVCSTSIEMLIIKLRLYLNTIYRFEQQFMMSCPSASQGAGDFLDVLKNLSIKIEASLNN